MKLEWQVAGGMLACEGVPTPVAGWQYGHLFLDFRPMVAPELREVPFAWMVSHLPTGLALVGLLTDLPQAKVLVEDLYAREDWGTVRPGGTPPPAVREWRDTLYCDHCGSFQTINPFTEVVHARGSTQ